MLFGSWCILALFICLWHPIEGLDLEALVRDVKFNKQIPHMAVILTLCCSIVYLLTLSGDIMTYIVMQTSAYTCTLYLTLLKKTDKTSMTS